MTNRAAKVLPAAFISCLAAISLTAGSTDAVEAAEDCLAAPKGQAPQGGHWYYRVDRTTKRHCWYVRNEGKTPQQDAKSVQSPEPQMPTALQDSVANARAELPAGSEPVEPTIAPQRQVPPEATSGTSSTDNVNPANAAGWMLASRWSNADANDSRQGAQSSDTADAKQRLQAAATRPPAEVDDNSAWMLAAWTSALALAAIVIAGIVGVLNYRRRRDIGIGQSTPPVWSDIDGGQISPVVRSRDEPVMNWVRIAREIEAAKNPGRDIEQLLARAPRRPLA